MKLELLLDLLETTTEIGPLSGLLKGVYDFLERLLEFLYTKYNTLYYLP
jgi:hypothetical protein